VRYLVAGGREERFDEMKRIKRGEQETARMSEERDGEYISPPMKASIAIR